MDRLKTALADRYTIERELGTGVYIVRDLKHERKVAAKVLPPELAARGSPIMKKRVEGGMISDHSSDMT